MITQNSTNEKASVNPTRGSTTRDCACTDSALDPMILRAVILYADYDSGCRSKAFFNQLATRLGAEVQFSLALWSMDALQQPRTAEVALETYGGADLVVLALRAESILPPAVRAWVESWAVSRADEASILVVLRDRPSPTTDNESPAAADLRELRHLAQRHGLSFICEWATQPSWESRVCV